MKIKVNIYDNAFVPTLGRGPFTEKFIDEELYRSLKRLGYLVEKINEVSTGKIVLASTEQPKPAVEPDPTADSPKEETTNPAESNTNQPEPTTEDDVDLGVGGTAESGLFTEEELSFLAKKAKRDEIIDLFTKKGVEMPNPEATIAELLALVGLERK